MVNGCARQASVGVVDVVVKVMCQVSSLRVMRENERVSKGSAELVVKVGESVGNVEGGVHLVIEAAPGCCGGGGSGSGRVVGRVG